MKLALLFMLCLLASAYGRPQAEEGLEDQEGLPEGGPEEGDEGSYEGEPDEGADEEGTSYDDPDIEGEEEPVDDDNTEVGQVKDKEAAGHGGYHHRRHHHHHHRRHHHYGGFGGFYRRHHHNHGYVDRSTCSVQASYFLSFNGQRRYCRYATDDHDDCQACCEAATRRETRNANKDDIIGFITLNHRHRGDGYRGKREAGYAAAAAAASDKGHDNRTNEPKWECVCCIPKANRD